MMKTSKLIFCSVLLLLLHLSCSRDEGSQEEPGVSQPNQARVTITLEVNNDSLATSRTAGMPESEPAAADTIRGVAASYSVGDFGTASTPEVAVDSLATRSTPVANVNESVVDDLWAIQFDENGKLVGKPVYQSGLRGKPQVTLMLTQTPAGKQHTVYFVTNTARADLLTENNVPTLERYRALLHSYTNEAGVVAGGVLLMTGQYTGALTDKGTIAQPIPLTRGVAKITFTYRTANFDDGTIRILAVQLKNVAHRTAYLVPTAAPYPAIGSHADYAPETAPDAAAGSYTWYLPENVRGINPAITWEGNKSKKNAPTGQGDCATLVEVRAEVTTRDGATSNIAYQFFIGQDITDYSVKRNRHYRLNIDFRGIDESDQRVVTGNSTPWLAATVGISDVSGTGATVRATITSDGGSPITARGFYVSEDKNEIGTTRAYLGAGLYVVEEMPSPFTRAAFVPEVIEQTLTGLKRTTTYYVRPYATNRDGTTVGEQATFSTTGAPTIVTVQVNSVKPTTAKVTYQITDNGASSITEKGVVYSTQKDFAPTASGVVKVPSASLTELTLGAGSASSNNPPLRENTTYYVRAYASNREGSSYGKQLLLTTLTAPVFQPVQLIWVKGLYVQAAVDVQSNPLYEKGVAWSETAIITPEQGSLKVVNNTGIVKQSTASATWYLYPYAIMELGDSPYYGADQYNHTKMPTPSTLTTSTNKENGEVTIEVTAQAGSVLSRGYCYSTKSGFDPVSGGDKVVEKAGTGNYTETITYGTLPIGTYYIRTYAVNAVGKSYSAQGEFEVKKPVPTEIQVGNTIWAAGNLYYDIATSEYKNATTQEYVHNVDLTSVPPVADSNGGSYFGWNTLSWIVGGGNLSGVYDKANDPCTKVAPAGKWVTPTMKQYLDLNKLVVRPANHGTEIIDEERKTRLFLPWTGYSWSIPTLYDLNIRAYNLTRDSESDSSGDPLGVYLYITAVDGSGFENGVRRHEFPPSAGASVRCVKALP